MLSVLERTNSIQSPCWLEDDVPVLHGSEMCSPPYAVELARNSCHDQHGAVAFGSRNPSESLRLLWYVPFHQPVSTQTPRRRNSVADDRNQIAEIPSPLPPQLGFGS